MISVVCRVVSSKKILFVCCCSLVFFRKIDNEEEYMKQPVGAYLEKVRAEERTEIQQTVRQTDRQGI